MSIFLMFFFILMFMGMIMFFFFLYMYMNSIMMFYEWECFFMKTISLEMVFFFDWMTFLFLSTVFFISSLVCMYSMEYMQTNKNKFIYLIFMFVMSMMLFVSSPNILSILIGWDGLGIISYILIIFFQNSKSKNSGMLTVYLNRIGDILIIFSSWYYYIMGSLNFIFFENFNLKSGVTMIIMASMTKSAQMPFSSWLPAAMAAPTPVSSLVHSSTLVTAGIYLMIRFNNYFLLSKNMIKLIFIMGSLTMMFSGMAANLEFDLKKIIALSTLSQLGFMMLTLSFKMINLSFFHLITHALFKALLFLCAGVMIHNMKDMQDIRYMGNMLYIMPICTMCFNIANLSLCGFPFLSGFYSKDLIIENMFMMKMNLFFHFILLFSTSLTVSYTFRLLYYFSILNSSYFVDTNKHESKLFNFVLIILTMFSIFTGTILNWILSFMNFEVFMNNNFKMIIPMIILLGLMMSVLSINNKYKMTFFMTLWYLNYLSLYFKKIPIFLTEKMFLSSSFGYFEYLGGQGIIFYINMKNKNNEYMHNMKLSLMFSFFFFFWL